MGFENSFSGNNSSKFNIKKPGATVSQEVYSGADTFTTQGLPDTDVDHSYEEFEEIIDLVEEFEDADSEDEEDDSKHSAT
jgi:chromosome condensin MukBEF MukE localization factor